jgi:hypothetical protein
MASVGSQLIEEVTAHAQSDNARYGQTVLTFRITAICHRTSLLKRNSFAVRVYSRTVVHQFFFKSKSHLKFLGASRLT